MPDCGATYDVGEVRTSCDSCGSLLDIDYDWDSLRVPKALSDFEAKWSRRHEPLCFSGVWRVFYFLPFLPPDKGGPVGGGPTVFAFLGGGCRVWGGEAGNP